MKEKNVMNEEMDLRKEETKMENELEKAEELEKEVQETGMSVLESFDNNLVQATKTNKRIQSTIEDPKILFNLEDHIDFKLNDMEGKEINVVNVVVKTYEKEIPEKVNEFTGEIETKERSMVTILIDDTNTSYVTASKLFGMRIIQLVQFYGTEKIHQGVKIRITKTSHKNGNKKLGFEIV